MKKLFCSVILATSCTLGAKAQLADGFYHIQNTVTGRYISVNDTDPGNYPVSQSGDVNMGGIRTYINYDTVAVSPSCVIYIKKLSNGKYDLINQGSSLYNMANKKLAIDIVPNGNGSYKIQGTAQGITKKLADGSPSESDSWMMNRLEEKRELIKKYGNITFFEESNKDLMLLDSSTYGLAFFKKMFSKFKLLAEEKIRIKDL